MTLEIKQCWRAAAAAAAAPGFSHGILLLFSSSFYLHAMGRDAPVTLTMVTIGDGKIMAH